MKKVQVNEILDEQSKRRKKITNYVFIILVFVIFAAMFFVIYTENNRTKYITYNENSDLDYKVYLKENDYFEDTYLNKGKQYIASLINYIDATFKYDFDIKDENINYQYSYRIESEVEVVDSSSKKTLFEKTDNVISKQSSTTNSKKNIHITDNVVVDYNYYNNLISQFVKDYDLDSYDSNLKIKMYVDVYGTCDEVIKGNNKEAVISLNIPLTSKTVAIDLGNDVTETNNNSIACKLSSDNYMFALYISLVFIGLGLITLYLMVAYIFKSRSADDIYESELRKILNKYHVYIQSVSKFDLKGYQLITVHNFDDLLEVRDCYQAPILMIESENTKEKKTSFYVPTDTKMMYVYNIKVK